MSFNFMSCIFMPYCQRPHFKQDTIITCMCMCVSLQIALRAVRGTGFSSDIAVDNVRLTLGRC